MTDETFRVTDQNRETVLRLALAIAGLKDVDATIPVRRQQMEQLMEQRRLDFEKQVQSVRGEKMEAVRAVEKDLLGGELPDGVFVTITQDGSEYTVHRPEPRLGPAPGKAGQVSGKKKSKGVVKALRVRKRHGRPPTPNRNGQAEKKPAEAQ